MIAEDKLEKLSYVLITSEKLDPMAMQVNRGSEMRYRNQNYKGKKCNYSHYTEHTKENCYKLVDYPTNLKLRGK